MVRAPKQVERFLTIDTPLGEDVLIITGMEGDESFSRLFRFRLELISPETDIDPNAILRKPVTVSVVCDRGRRRYFHGIIRSFAATGVLQSRLRRYSAEMVPSFWLLTRNTDCRIFQNQTAVEIIEQVFADRGLTDYDTGKLSASYKQRTYCVQYRETDFDFVSRLMEEEGIFYYFKHEDGRHTVTLCDNARAYEPAADSAVYLMHGRSGFERVMTWARHHAVPTGGVTTRDYNPLEPTANMESTEPTTAQSADRALTFFDYPGLYEQKGDGDSLAGVRIEEEEASTNRTTGRSEVRSFSPGYTFTIDGAEGEEGIEYALSWVSHHIVDNSQVVGGSPQSPGYRNEFACLPATTVFRPPRVTPKAQVRGLQTAVVVGPSGSEIYTDEHGRIKVQFFWDRYGENDENSSCWIRVAQIWAGAQWGAQFIPRIGHEVVVAFLEGDPDRPIVVGSVYNGRNAPPFDLPANKTQSGVRTRSSLNGSSSNCNELKFEDKKGSELVFLHAEKDLLHEVENDETIEIGNDQSILVKNNRTEVVDKGDETITIKSGNETREVTVGKRSTKIGNTETLTVKSDISTKSDMGHIDTLASMGNITTKASMGNIDLDATLGKISLTAMQSIELKVGMNSVKIDQMGVTVKGMMVKLDGTMMTSVKGMMTEINGTGMLTIKGGMLMIN